MAATLTDPLIGHVVDGRYEVLSRIARGGMATVYLATDRRLDREVALKVMHPHLADGASGSDFVARFRREARAAARLTHPGLVGVYDQGVDGETSYLTMEYVDGPTLRRRLTTEGSLTVGEALRVTESVLDALAVAHRAHLVHRDIKPENVLVPDDGRVKVADFGLARAVTEASATATGTVLGTVAYLAPELVTQGASDARTDVYAVGILLYEMLTGRQPFTGATPIQVAYQHVNDDVPGPSDVVPWLPVELDELVQALAARDPDERPAEAGAALTMLRRTRAALDDGTLARRADVTPSEDAAETPDAAGDSDATAALTGVARERSERGRTVALPVGAVDLVDDGRDDRTEGAEPADDVRRWRRRVTAVLAVVAIGALTGIGLVWYWTSGPGAWTTVPSGLAGTTQAEAEAALDELGIGSTAVEAFDPVVAEGLVVDSDPAAGERVHRDGTVELVVSKGPDLRVVPADLVGTPVADATAALEEAGFVVPEPESAYDDTVPAGAVLSASAEPGASLPVGTEVALTVSDGPAPVTVISVVGVPLADARAQLEADGLVVAEQQDFSEQYPKGTVMAQAPAPGTEGFRGDTVTVTVSQGPPLVEVPDVVGKQFGEARQQLEQLGLVVVREDVLGGFFGTVRTQDVTPGSAIPKGSTVTLAVV
ncbi:Stk1 family PASTA domain-containing Ser/Thr kinase [Cellulomonas carbonis]|uniref:non-specific serine/threonine protein kinase n=1 Tax=Cellulomonas carbonis T26 TaxID=947969 RepID=A0A0A0BS60_9CELL|nr:Stk1 family PASTA domain-containing Ser/Thr kinase [Cellulomonas carbonis]KGM10517.1 serine/threonine protein kinase [Cellulomonas carbonis T26]GGB93128.1 serine/threonine protein kinase [Cellulomonas carbonis]